MIVYFLFSVDEMGRDIISAAKDVVVQQQKARLCDGAGEAEGVTAQYKALQLQVQSLEHKLELVLKKLQ